MALKPQTFMNLSGQRGAVRHSGDNLTGRGSGDDEQIAVDLTRLDEPAIAQLGIGRKFQTPTVFDMHTVEDNIRAVLELQRNEDGKALSKEKSRRYASAGEMAKLNGATTIKMASAVDAAVLMLPVNSSHRPKSSTAIAYAAGMSMLAERVETIVAAFW